MKNNVNHDNFKEEKTYLKMNEKKVCLKINKAYVYAFLETASGLLLLSHDNTKHETTDVSIF